jgi:hypothetical protein
VRARAAYDARFLTEIATQINDDVRGRLGHAAEVWHEHVLGLPSSRSIASGMTSSHLSSAHEVSFSGVS